MTQDAERMRINAGKLIVLLLLSGFLSTESLLANPLGDFFKRLGRSIVPSRPGKNSERDDQNRDGGRRQRGTPEKPGNKPEAPPDSANPSASVTATPMPEQPKVKVASASQSKSKRDIPYAMPVPNKPGFVTSPYAPNHGYVDVRGFPSGTEVKDPYTGKILLTP